MEEVEVVYLSELPMSEDWETSCMEVKQYCMEANAHYYSKPSEDFCLMEAVEEARSLFCPIVLVDSLS